VQSSCDALTEYHVDPIDDASNGLSMLVQGVWHCYSSERVAFQYLSVPIQDSR
jgi:hypothetical protein